MLEVSDIHHIVDRHITGKHQRRAEIEDRAFRLCWVRNGIIQDDDMVLMLLLDASRLYAHKASDCWIYSWVLFDLSPDERYKKKHVLPGGFIPDLNVEEDWRFVVEKPGLDVLSLAGIFEDFSVESEGDDYDSTADAIT